MPIFEGVMTTTSVSIVDKAGHDGECTNFDITPGFQVVTRRHGMTRDDFVCKWMSNYSPVIRNRSSYQTCGRLIGLKDLREQERPCLSS